MVSTFFAADADLELRPNVTRRMHYYGDPIVWVFHLIKAGQLSPNSDSFAWSKNNEAVGVKT